MSYARGRLLSPSGRAGLPPYKQMGFEAGRGGSGGYLPQLLAQPVRHERPVLVRDVVADVVSIRVDHQRRIGCFARDPLRMRRREQAVFGAVDHEEWLSDPAQDTFEVERVSHALG